LNRLLHVKPLISGGCVVMAIWQYPDVTCNLQPVDGVELILVEQRR
jgi:hypothetical protein